MPPFLSSSKALVRLLSGRSLAADLRTGLGSLKGRRETGTRSECFEQARCSSSIARIKSPSIGDLVDSGKDSEKEVLPLPGKSLHYSTQRRCFLGCGDGEERDVLSKVHEERLVMGYSPEQLFAVVAAVDMYEDFVPWCQRSRIIKQNGDGSFDAELEIGFKFLVESYISHVEMEKPKYIKTTATESGLFDHLINIWEFSPGPVPGTCHLHFLVDFKFQSPLYRRVASMFFSEVVSQLVSSFSDRCRRIYGPATRVLETNFRQNT